MRLPQELDQLLQLGNRLLLAGDDRPRDFKVNYFNSEGVREELTGLLVTNNVPTTINKQFSKSLIEPVTFVVPSIFFLVVIAYLFLSWRWSVGLFATKSASRRLRHRASRRSGWRGSASPFPPMRGR